MLKKLLLGSFALILCFSVGGCSKKTVDAKAADLYETAIEQLKDLKSSKFNAKLLVDMDNQIAKIEFLGSYDVTSTLAMEMVCNAAMNGVKVNDLLNFYVKDDMMYMNTMEQTKEKQPLYPLTSAFDQNLSANKTNFDADYNFTSMTAEEKEGKTYIHAILNKEQMKQVKDLSDDMYANLMDGYTIGELHNPSFDFIIDKDNSFDEISLTMKIGYCITDEEPKIMSIKFTIQFDDKNQVKEVLFPDLNDYLIVENEDGGLIENFDNTPIQNL